MNLCRGYSRWSAPNIKTYISVLWIPDISVFHQVVAFSLVHHSPVHERARSMLCRNKWSGCVIISQCISAVFICYGQMGEVWKEEEKDCPLLKDFTTEWVSCKLRGWWVLVLACFQLCFLAWVESTIWLR